MKKVFSLCLLISIFNTYAAESRKLISLCVERFNDGAEAFALQEEGVSAYYAKHAQEEVENMYPIPFSVTHTRETFAPYNDILESEQTRVYFSYLQLATLKEIMQEENEQEKFDQLKSFLMGPSLFYCHTQLKGYSPGSDFAKGDHSLKIGTSKKDENDISFLTVLGLLSKKIGTVVSQWYTSKKPEDEYVQIRLSKECMRVARVSRSDGSDVNIKNTVSAAAGSKKLSSTL
ncbi:MAG: hypothetical protein WD055_06100 [Candidatus Dependentiae bacterium]